MESFSPLSVQVECSGPLISGYNGKNFWVFLDIRVCSVDVVSDFWCYGSKVVIILFFFWKCTYGVIVLRGGGYSSSLRCLLLTTSPAWVTIGRDDVLVRHHAKDDTKSDPESSDSNSDTTHCGVYGKDRYRGIGGICLDLVYTEIWTGYWITFVDVLFSHFLL